MLVDERDHRLNGRSLPTRFRRCGTHRWKAGGGGRAPPSRNTPRHLHQRPALLSGRATVSLLNSGENSRPVFGIAHLHAPTGLAKMSAEAGGPSTYPPPVTLFADGAGMPARSSKRRSRGWIAWPIDIIKRCDTGKFVVLPRRWIVARTLAWLDPMPTRRQGSEGIYRPRPKPGWSSHPSGERRGILPHSNYQSGSEVDAKLLLAV